MKRLSYSVPVLAVSSILSLAISSQAAQAQVAYGSYIGVGPTVGLIDDAQVGGVVAFRYKILESPISFRAQALVGKNTAVVPTVSYDIPLNWQTDAYLGAGVVLASGDSSSPVGNKISFALQPGGSF